VTRQHRGYGAFHAFSLRHIYQIPRILCRDARLFSIFRAQRAPPSSLIERDDLLGHFEADIHAAAVDGVIEAVRALTRRDFLQPSRHV